MNLRPSGYEKDFRHLGGVGRGRQAVAASGLAQQPDSSAGQPMAARGRRFAAALLLGTQPITGPLETLLNVREVAARLQVSTATVYKIVDRGEIATVRVANSIRVRPADLAEYLRRG